MHVGSSRFFLSVTDSVCPELTIAVSLHCPLATLAAVGMSEEYIGELRRKAEIATSHGQTGLERGFQPHRTVFKPPSRRPGP
jgi:hypothetical protein